MISFENYQRVKTLAEAYELNQSLRNVVGGGMMWLHLSEAEYDTFIDLCDLGLDQIEEDDQYFRIGAMTTLSQLENYRAFEEYFDQAFSDSLKHIVGVQFRNCATIGGSICARLGFSDILTLLLPLDTRLVFYKQGEISLQDFLASKNQWDILSHVLIPKKKQKVIFDSIRKTYTDIPVINICASKNEEGIKIAVGSRPAAAVLVQENEIPIFGNNQRGSKEYREHLYEVMLKRIMKEMEEV